MLRFMIHLFLIFFIAKVELNFLHFKILFENNENFNYALHTNVGRKNSNY